MNWGLVIALIVSVALNVLFAVLVSRQSTTAMLRLDEAHERTTTYTAGLVDRLMSQDWVTYKAYEVDQDIEQESLPPPELQVVRGPDRGGFGSRLGLTAWHDPSEEELEAMNEEIP